MPNERGPKLRVELKRRCVQVGVIRAKPKVLKGESNMTKAEKIQAIKEFNARIREEQGKGSTGFMGKWVDFHARDFLMAKGVETESDIRCRAADKTDFTLRYNGRSHKGEAKTGAGSWKFSKAEWTEDDIFPGVELFVIAAETEFLTEENFADQLWVATREQYIAMLKYTGGKKGLASSLNYDSKHGLMKIQPYTTRVYDKKYGKYRYASARLTRFYDFVEQEDLPTLREFRDMVRG